ncbi:MAG: hypothetical protein WBM41_02415 [Arenicellales bacterium]
MGTGGSRKKVLIAVTWPSFVCAGIFTALLFAFVDPYVLMDEIGVHADSRLAGYSLAFLYLWLVGIVVAAMALFIMCTPDPGKKEGNQT